MFHILNLDPVQAHLQDYFLGQYWEVPRSFERVFKVFLIFLDD